MVSTIFDIVRLLISGWWWLVLGLTVLCILCFVALCLSDCDLLLALYSRWGKAPAKVLRGKVVWITGASSGIGEELSYALAKAGAVLILSARRTEELQRVLEQCKILSPTYLKDKHMILPMDLTKTDEHSSLVQRIIQRYDKIDYLVNNAGRSQRAEAVCTELNVDRALMDLNVLSTISLTKAVLPKMLEKREGSIVVISSVAGKLGAPGSATYSASKHALQGYFDTLRVELFDKDISILSICPGPVDTPFVNNIFRENMTASSVRGPPTRAGGKRVSAKRCADLIAVAMANQLSEVWISKHPVLLFVYMVQYFPNFSKWLGNHVGNKRLKAIKRGENEVDNFTGYLR